MDYHVHSIFSDDSEEQMETVVKKAIRLELNEICFTDHVDYGVKAEYDDNDEIKAQRKDQNVNYPQYVAEIERLQKKYQEKIKIKLGLEFGIQTHTISQFQKLYDRLPLDFVILSCHQVEDKEFWNYDFQKGRTQDEYNERYYQEIFACIQEYKDYSVLGHLDMIQRYNETRHPFEKSQSIIEKILAQIIQDEKGLEVNTSSFRYDIPDLMPERRILTQYHDMGGKIITIGSDAHEVTSLANRIPYIKEELKKIGFQYECSFEKMVPSFQLL
jgi:histidinol-phosphatase (PHP family)